MSAHMSASYKKVALSVPRVFGFLIISEKDLFIHLITLHMYSMYIAALTKKCFDHRIFTMEIGIDM